MDWDSPTTKKYIKEAEAQGCKLLGAGKSANYRLYALPCGHKQGQRPDRMRNGIFECKTCFAEKLNLAAKEQDCKLLGAGKNSRYRLYKLPCGHEQEVHVDAMYRGNFRCHVCLDEKLNLEAKAQGCKVLGAGKNAQYRLYKLPCGHEKEIPTNSIREGTFRCSVCLKEKLNKEAEAHECKLIGAGKNHLYRLYALPCRHEQEVQISAMREGVFRCGVCMDEMLRQEAEAQGCRLIGVGQNANYRSYALPCGHEREIKTGHMRDGNFRCPICVEEKLRQEAEAQGCMLLGAGRNSLYRMYALPCEHEQQITKSSMRLGSFRCSICMEEKLRKEAESHGCKLLGPGSSALYRSYALPCGHEREIRLEHIRDGNFRCPICVEERLRQEAEAQGCKLVGAGRDKRNRLYVLPCGHEQVVSTDQMLKGYISCHTCEETSRTQPSNLYLLHIKVDSDEWLKLGYAKVVESRVSEYGLPPGSEVKTVCVLPIATGNEAHALEADIHSRYRNKRLSQENMTQFHTRSGAGECYPVIMLDTLLQELEASKPPRTT